jgi:hypothetical protein
VPPLSELRLQAAEWRAEAGLALGKHAELVVPRQLPAAAAGFAGRSAEREVLTGLAEQAAGGAGAAVVISAIGGTAGVGKTALAVHFEHRVARRFPDGQLYADLRGFSPAAEPAPPARVVRGFLEAPGVAPQAVPDISASAAASLARMEPARAGQLLTELAHFHLIAEHTPGRYAFHDLLRAYAGEQACAVDSDSVRRSATGRVLDHYLHTRLCRRCPAQPVAHGARHRPAGAGRGNRAPAWPSAGAGLV